MRVLVAPQEFKGSLSALQAAESIASGARRAVPSADIDLLPLSDGGPGFLQALHAAIDGAFHQVEARDALRRPVTASILQAGNTVFVEAAEANGLWRLHTDELDPLNAGTEGVGDLLLAAAKLAPARIVIGVGGSATSDGGAGMARALGARFTGMDGAELRPGAAPLADLVRVDWQRPALFEGIDIIVATDVENPLLGPEGAAHVYGPQKGANPQQVDQLEAALFRYATTLRRAFAVDVAFMPGAGAAGGLAAGLIAFLGARVESGFDVVADATDLRGRVEQAELVLTGEGSYDAQSAMGKVTGRVQRMAEEAGRRCIILAGRADDAGEDVHTLSSIETDTERAIANASGLLEQLAEAVLSPR